MGFVLEATFKHGAGVRVLRSAEDIDQFMAELLAAGPNYRAATVYAIDEDTDADPKHELVVGVDPERELGSVRYAGDDGEFYSRGEQTNPDGVAYNYFGTGHDFPADSEVPLSVVKQAIAELLTSGGSRPIPGTLGSGEDGHDCGWWACQVFVDGFLRWERGALCAADHA
ncbi:Imm1 family immunity protein, partial [Actinokineospora sp.]|uniref:Imm1 family immunity protein n=1 Tax=Actinokineospora sp. TaxID=1872133 RepID=UPI003D6B5E78